MTGLENVILSAAKDLSLVVRILRRFAPQNDSVENVILSEATAPAGTEKINSNYFEKSVDNQKKPDIIVYVVQLMNANNLAGLCKGSTADSDSVCEGSNPSPAAKKT
jgi:hypothetical protein